MFMNYVIEKNIPIPKKQKVFKPEYSFWFEMEIGDSILVDTLLEAQRIQSYINNWFGSKKIKQMQMPNGVRLWRME